MHPQTSVHTTWHHINMSHGGTALGFKVDFFHATKKMLESKADQNMKIIIARSSVDRSLWENTKTQLLLSTPADSSRSNRSSLQEPDVTSSLRI